MISAPRGCAAIATGLCLGLEAQPGCDGHLQCYVVGRQRFELYPLVPAAPITDSDIPVWMTAPSRWGWRCLRGKVGLK